MYIGRMQSDEKGRNMNDNRPRLEAPKIVVEGEDGEPVDKYTAGIELSNACRRFYVSRLQAAEKVKETLGMLNTPKFHKQSKRCDCQCQAKKESNNNNITNTSSKHGKSHKRDCPKANKSKSSIENSMEVLKREMASLVDQDLALMKQLLTLNEQIEELKWQRKLQGYSRGSLASSYMDSSVCTLSDVEGSTNELKEPPPKYPSPSSLSLYDNVDSEEQQDCKSCTGSGNESTSSDFGSCDNMEDSLASLPNSDNISSSSGDFKKCPGEQQSFDSGIHEPDSPSTPTACTNVEILL